MRQVVRRAGFESCLSVFSVYSVALLSDSVFSVAISVLRGTLTRYNAPFAKSLN